MSSAVFPSLVGLAFPIQREPLFAARVQRSVSGREVRISDYPYPIWQWSLPFAYLPLADWQTLAGFYAARQGEWDSFLYADPSDDSVTGQEIGIGNASTTAFQLLRTLGSFTEPILAPNTSATLNVYLNGVSVSQPGNWSVNSDGVLTFTNPPGSGVVITADFSYYFRCRFRAGAKFTQFMNQIWSVKQLSFRSLFL